MRRPCPRPRQSRPGRHRRRRRVCVLSLPRILRRRGPEPAHAPRLCARGDGIFDSLEAKGVTQLAAIESVHVATYIEQLSRARPRRPQSCAWPPCATCSIGWSSARSCQPIRPRPCAVRATSCGGAKRRRSIPPRPAHRHDRHHDHHWPPRPRLDWPHGLFVRAHRRGDRHTGVETRKCKNCPARGNDAGTDYLAGRAAPALALRAT